LQGLKLEQGAKPSDFPHFNHCLGPPWREGRPPPAPTPAQGASTPRPGLSARAPVLNTKSAAVIAAGPLAWDIPQQRWLWRDDVIPSPNYSSMDQTAADGCVDTRRRRRGRRRPDAPHPRAGDGPEAAATPRPRPD